MAGVTPTGWEFTITGCGTSHGNPPIGIPRLWSSDVRDRRRRAGGLLRGPGGAVVLIDAGPDLMDQLRDPYRDWDGTSYPERAVLRCDALILTHDHADHTHGFNDLRHLNRLMREPGKTAPAIPIYGHAGHLDQVQAMFPYCFGKGPEFYELSAPSLVATPVVDDQPITICGLTAIPFHTSHGSAGRTTGWRLGDLGYLTDLKSLPVGAERHLQNLDLLVLDMLREETHETHLCWAEAMAIWQRLRPRRTVLTHMGHEVRWAAWQDRLPQGMEMAVDGWRTVITGASR